MDEREKIERQLELATRVAETIKDESTIQRLRNFADELRQKLRRMVWRPKVRARAYELSEEAGPVVTSSFGWRRSVRSKTAWTFEERQAKTRLNHWISSSHYC